MQFLKQKLNLRVYQQTILNTALSKNTLCVIPTGLGKTYIAIALIGLKLKEKKAIFLAPTKPLVTQHFNTFKQFFDSEPEEIIEVSGTVPSKKRKEMYKKAKIIFATPQTIENDIITKRILPEEFSIAIFDEAHRAVGDYAYVFLAKQFKESRILALTASPGHEIEKINEIKNNLFIQEIEKRTQKDKDVKEYVKEIKFQYKKVELPKLMKAIQKHLKMAMKEYLVQLKELDIIDSTSLSKFSRKNLLNLQTKLRTQISTGDFEIMRALSITARLIKINYALHLLESESLNALNDYLKSIWKDSKTTKTKAVKALVQNFHIRAAYRLSQECKEKKIEHPKMLELKKTIKQELKKNPNSKILIFTEYRSNVEQIVQELSEFKIHQFVGQSSLKKKGMSQKEQIKAIEDLKTGKVNVLVCTSVAEEGLDIPKVDLIVLYSPIPSAIRSIQRKGRTGRQEVGNLVVLLTKDTKDETYHWISVNRERKMNQVLTNMSQSKSKLITLDSFQNKSKEKQTVENREEIKVYCDCRESGILKYLIEHGVTVLPKKLEVADFILSDDIAVERKEVEDFTSSLIDQRLFNQATELKRNFEKPLFIIEGDLSEIFFSRNINPDALRSAMISLLVDYQIPFLFSSNKQETAKYLYLIAKREQIEKKKLISLRGSKRLTSIPEMQQFFIEGLPLIGPALTKKLLKHFKTPKALLNASKEELQNVKNLGPKKAEKIKMILEEIYDEE